MKADLLQGGFICFAYALNKRSEQKEGMGGFGADQSGPVRVSSTEKNKKVCQGNGSN